MTYRLLRPSVPPLSIATADEAWDAVEALDSTKERAVLCGVRDDGTLAEAIVRVGMNLEEARELAAVAS